MNRESESNVNIDDAPAMRIAAAINRFGEQRVAERAMSLLDGGNEGDEFLLIVGGRHAQGILDGAPPLYWPELWGARALGFVWNEAAAPAVLRGLNDQAWRVREMCAKICLQRGIGQTLQFLNLMNDENPRVRAAGAHALGEFGSHETANALRALLTDTEKDVRRAAQQALSRLRERHGDAVPARDAEPAPLVPSTYVEPTSAVDPSESA